MDKGKKLSTAAVEPEVKKDIVVAPAKVEEEPVAAPVKVEKEPVAAPAKAEKKPAAKPRAAKAKAKTEVLKPVVMVQFQGSEVDLDALVEAAKADFRQSKKRTSITDLKLYVKPEEHTAYYVINETYNGSVAF